MTEEKFSELKDISIENSETEKQNKTENTHNRLYKNCETTIKVITHIVRIPEGEERMKKKKEEEEVIFQAIRMENFCPIIVRHQIVIPEHQRTPSKINTKNFPLSMSYSNTEKIKRKKKLHKKVRQ